MRVLKDLGDAQSGSLGTVVMLDEDWFDRPRLWVKFSPKLTLAYLAEDVRKLSLLEILAEESQ